MSSNTGMSSNFSFRMFDLYRRFVEVLQLNPNYLVEFKTGSPSKETCHIIIKKVFQHRQSEERIEHFTEYLLKNAEIIANHAENIPNTWSEAIKYTDTCLDLIRKYLRKKGIDIKSNLHSTEELVENLSELLFTHPSETQIQAVRDYLKYDIQNPKRTIISLKSTKKSKNVIQTLPKEHRKLKKLNVTVSKENNIKMDIKQPNDNSMEIENESKVILEPIEKMNENDSKELLNKDVNVSHENSMEIKETELQMLLHIENAKSENELQHIEEPKRLEVPSKIENLNESHNLFIMETDKIHDVKFIKSLLTNSVNCDSPMDQYIIQIVEKGDSNQNEAIMESITSNEIQQNSSIQLKRKNFSNDDDHNCMKKSFFSKDIINVKEEQFKTGFKNIIKENDYEVVQLSTENSVVPENAFTCNQTKSQVSLLKNMLDTSEKEKMCECKSKYSTNCNLKNRNKYSEVVNMTYTEVLKLVETIMNFCELKNEISLEEFLVLRRTRDKIQWKSLKEKNSSQVNHL